MSLTECGYYIGAALYGAGITRGFRTKDIRVQDITPHGIEVSYEADKNGTETEARTVKSLLFPALSKLGAVKTITFKKAADFSLLFSYDKIGMSSYMFSAILSMDCTDDSGAHQKQCLT